jgi:hypothetical protein
VGKHVLDAPGHGLGNMRSEHEIHLVSEALKNETVGT